MSKRVYSSEFHPDSKISKVYRILEREYNLSIARDCYAAVLLNLRRCLDCEDNYMVAQLVGVTLPVLLRFLNGSLLPNGVVTISIIMVLMDLGYDKGIFKSEV